jgi:hypothetical protein
MAAFAPLTLDLTAVDTEVLTPQSINANGVATWLGTDPSFDAKKSATMQVVVPKSNGTVARVKQRVSIPLMDAFTGLKTGDNYVNIEAVFAKATPAAYRMSLLFMARDLLNEAITEAAYENLEAIY